LQNIEKIFDFFSSASSNDHGKYACLATNRQKPGGCHLDISTRRSGFVIALWKYPNDDQDL
jgi:hypothetical protein